jgi:hypothetical protein
VRATLGESAVPTTEIVRFTHDANEYVGMLRDHRMFYSEPVPILNQSPCQATVDFGRQAHVYDVRAGRYLGRRQQVRATLAPAQAHLYALLPYRVKAIRVAEVPSGHDLGKNFALRVVPAERHTSGAHVLHVEVTDANGRSRPEYSQNLKAPRGFTRFRLPLALSDPSGEWRLRVRDTATGVAGEERFFMEIKDPREDPQTLRNGPGAMRWRIARSEVDWLVGCSGTSQLTH